MFLLLGSAGCGHAVEQSASQESMKGLSQRMPGEYVITMTSDGTQSMLRDLYDAYDIVGIEDLGRGRFLLRLSKDPGVEEVERAGRESAEVTGVQPNVIYHQQMR